MTTSIKLHARRMGANTAIWRNILDYKFMGNVAGDNAEALRELALAPAPPSEVTVTHVLRTAMGYAWIRWSAHRMTRSAQDSRFCGAKQPTRSWSVYEFVPSGNEATLDGVSPDNHFFAVRAVGKNGARSLAVPAVVPMRRLTPPAASAPKAN